MIDRFTNRRLRRHGEFVCRSRLIRCIRACVRTHESVIRSTIHPTATRRHVIHEYRLVEPVTTPAAFKFQTVIHLPTLFNTSERRARARHSAPLCHSDIMRKKKKNQYLVADTLCRVESRGVTCRFVVGKRPLRCCEIHERHARPERKIDRVRIFPL